MATRPESSPRNTDSVRWPDSFVRRYNRDENSRIPLRLRSLNERRGVLQRYIGRLPDFLAKAEVLTADKIDLLSNRYLSDHDRYTRLAYFVTWNQEIYRGFLNCLRECGGKFDLYILVWIAYELESIEEGIGETGQNEKEEREKQMKAELDCLLSRLAKELDPLRDKVHELIDYLLILPHPAGSTMENDTLLTPGSKKQLERAVTHWEVLCILSDSNYVSYDNVYVLEHIATWSERHELWGLLNDYLHTFSQFQRKYNIPYSYPSESVSFLKPRNFHLIFSEVHKEFESLSADIKQVRVYATFHFARKLDHDSLITLSQAPDFNTLLQVIAHGLDSESYHPLCALVEEFGPIHLKKRLEVYNHQHPVSSEVQRRQKCFANILYGIFCRFERSTVDLSEFCAVLISIIGKQMNKDYVQIPATEHCLQFLTTWESMFIHLSTTLQCSQYNLSLLTEILACHQSKLAVDDLEKSLQQFQSETEVTMCATNAVDGIKELLSSVDPPLHSSFSRMCIQVHEKWEEKSFSDVINYLPKLSKEVGFSKSALTLIRAEVPEVSGHVPTDIREGHHYLPHCNFTFIIPLELTPLLGAQLENRPEVKVLSVVSSSPVQTPSPPRSPPPIQVVPFLPSTSLQSQSSTSLDSSYSSTDSSSSSQQSLIHITATPMQRTQSPSQSPSLPSSKTNYGNSSSTSSANVQSDGCGRPIQTSNPKPFTALKSRSKSL